MVCPKPSSISHVRLLSALCPTATLNNGTAKHPESLCPASALPPLGRRVPSPRRALPLPHRSYRLIRRSRHLSSPSALASLEESLQVAISPCCCRDLPDVILRILPQLPEPLPRRSRWVRLPGSSPASSAFPSHKMGWLPASFREHDFSRVPFRGCSYFVMFRPPSLLASQIVPTAASFPAGQPRRFHPSRTRVVTFARIGYACRPTTGNWRREDFHLAGFAALSAAPYGPVLLRRPFRFHLAMDTLPSEVQQVKSREQAQWL
jgi:hypothetical protein